MNRDSIALSVLPGLLATINDPAAACARAFAVADAFLDARSVEPVVCIGDATCNDSTMAACHDMGRSLFEVELSAGTRALFVATINEWVAAGRLPNHEEATHAMLAGLYDALMDVFAQGDDAGADQPPTEGKGLGECDPEVRALIEMFELPSVDAGSPSDAPAQE